MEDIFTGVACVAFTFGCSVALIWFCASEMHKMIKNKLLRCTTWIFVAMFIAFANISAGEMAWELASNTMPVEYD